MEVQVSVRVEPGSPDVLGSQVLLMSSSPAYRGAHKCEFRIRVTADFFMYFFLLLTNLEGNELLALIDRSLKFQSLILLYFQGEQWCRLRLMYKGRLVQDEDTLQQVIEFWIGYLHGHHQWLICLSSLSLVRKI